jgi:hypothetical protein
MHKPDVSELSSPPCWASNLSQVLQDKEEQTIKLTFPWNVHVPDGQMRRMEPEIASINKNKIRNKTEKKTTNLL